MSKDSLEQKKQLLRQMLEQKAKKNQQSVVASPGQHALWGFAQVHPESPAYHLKFSAGLRPGLHKETLINAINQLIARHAALRSVFNLQEGQLQQHFTEQLIIDLTERHITAEDINQQILDDYAVPFDLNKGPLIRAYLYSISDNEQVLLLVIHHMVIDGVSLLHLVSELGLLLNGQLLKTLDYDYRHYLHYQQKLPETPSYQASQAYWLNQLKDVNTRLNLPYDRERALSPDFVGSTVDKSLSQAETLALKALAKEQKLTLHALLLGVFQLLLHAVTRQQQLLSVTPCLGRNKDEFFSIVGYFANMVVIKTDSSAGLSVADFLQQCQATLVDALHHQAFPFSKLVQALSIKQDPTQLPLAQAAFAFHQPLSSSQGLGVALYEEQKNELMWQGVEVKPFRVSPIACQFELYLVALEELDGSISLHFEYMKDVFNQSTIELIASHFMQLVGAVVREPFQSLEVLPIFEPQEKLEKRIAQYNATHKEYPEVTVTELCHDAIIKHAASLAAVDAYGEYSYQQLLQLSYGLAKKLPTGEPQAIGILLEKGVNQLAAVLATLWTGNYFIPINLDNPPARINDIIRQSNLHTMITTNALAASKQLSQTNIIDVNTNEPVEQFAVRAASPDHLLYVIYTSGTTGIPKGVAISHRSLLNTVLAINEMFKIGPTDSAFAISDLSFDLAMYDVFGLMLAGGKLIFCSQAQIKEPKQWLHWVNQYRVSVWNSVPMLFSMLLEQAESDLPLKHVFLSGDWINVEVVDKGHTLCPLAQIVSLGGPTETTIWSIHYPLHRGIQYDFIPYGFPLPNHRYYVLDDQLNLCRYGQLGELYVAGTGLAQSYLNDPERTAKTFITHGKYGRLYRSGDMGFMTDEQGIRIKGRTDRQVKVGGYRIELDDIRLAMEKAFTGFTVTCSTSGKGSSKRLLGFIQTKVKSEKGFEILEHIERDLRFSEAYQSLCELLPGYMVPDLFVLMSAFPLNKNNKIDYPALPAIDSEQQGTQNGRALTKTERQIAEIWAAALNVPVENLNPESHFFHLGGDSLSAVSVINAIDKNFHISCSLKIVFDSPVLHAFSECIEAITSQGLQGLPLVQINTKDRYQEFALTPVQQAYWIGRQSQVDLGDVGSHSYYEFDLATVDIERFHRALDLTIARHDMLRMLISDNGQQRVLAKVPTYPLEVIDLMHCSPDQQKEILDASRDKMSHEIIAMDKFPGFHIKIFQLTDRARIVISYDSLQFDAWSFLVFIADLSKNYRQPTRVQTPLTIQFRDYIEYLQQLTKSALYQEAKQYWQRRIPQLPSGPQLPVQPISNQQVFQRLSGHLPQAKWTQLVAKAKDMSCTPTCLMLTAYALVIRQYSRQPSFCLNLTLFNRLDLHPDIEQVIGDFTSLILFEVKHSKTPQSFAACLQQMQQQLVSDLDNRLYDGINVQRDLRRFQQNNATPIAPVVFTSTLGFTKPRLLDDEEENQVNIHYAITQTPQVWLDLQIREDNEGVYWFWDYLQALFQPTTIEAMHRQFMQLLEDLVDQEWQHYSMQGLLPATKQRLLDFNATTTTLPTLSLTAGVAAACAAHADKVAIIDSAGSMTYQDLFDAAKSVAAVIKAAHYPANSALGIFLEKGRDQVIACLAVLFAGHHFVPFNLANPSNRLSLLIKESRICAMVSTVDLAHRFNLSTDILIELPTAQNVNPITTIASPELGETAYVIYTSGSTGVPKGVVISHYGVMNTLMDINKRFNVSTRDKVLALSDLSFDLAIYDMFGLLLAGGSIVFPQPDLVKEPHHWLDLVTRHGISVWNSVPMLYAMLLHAGQNLPSLKTVLLSGDWIMPEVVEKGFNLCPNADIAALGGATECSIWSNCYRLQKEVTYDFIPYGYPLANQSFYILHQDLSLCPEGVEGELYIGGIGLAKAYFGDEEKTAKAFIEHPAFGRLYRTGDWGLMTLDCGIKFLGRQDSQVKIGGYRIELNEIEHSLRQCLALDELLVDVQELNNSKRIIAYCVVNDKEEEKKLQQLAQANIRVFADNKTILRENAQSDVQPWFNRKSYRQWMNEAIPLPEIQQILSDEQLTHIANKKNEIWQSLGLISAVKDPAMPVAKYLYPSAGGLYPVQCYLSIAEKTTGIPKGCYYFSPIASSLTQLSDKPMHSGDELFLIADSALMSGYYPSNWQSFCELEAGHMASLLNQHVQLTPSDTPINRQALQLHEEHLVLAQFQLGKEDSISTTAFSFRLCLPQEQQIYTYQEKKKEWSEASAQLVFSSPGANTKIVKNAAAFILFPEKLSPFLIGWQAQAWMQALTKIGIGCCYLGNLSVTEDNKSRVQLAIALGPVSQSNMDSHAISQNPFSQQELIQQAYTKLQAELPAYMIPAEFILLDKLPLNANGKVDKNALPKVQQATETTALPIVDTFEIKVAGVWKEVLGFAEEDIYQNSDFFALGGDSLKALEMLTLLKTQYGIQVELKTLFNAAVLKSFCEQLRLSQMYELIESPELVALSEPNKELPVLVMIHPGTGTLDCYLGFANDYSATYELVGIQYKNKKARNLYQLAKHYAAQIMEHFPDRTIHILGYSLGAHLAFEIAKTLDSKHFSYTSIALVDALPIADPEEIFYETEGEMNLFEKVLGEDYAVTQDKLHLFLSYINDRQNALLSLCADYQTTGTIQKPIAYFKAKEPTPYLKTRVMAETQQSWGAYSNQSVSEFTVNGNHMTIFSKKHIASFTQSYLNYLAELIQ